MLRCVQAFGGLLVLDINISLIVVDTAIPPVAILFRDQTVAIVQITTTTITAAIFLFYIPWRELIDLKTQRENP